VGVASDLKLREFSDTDLSTDGEVCSVCLSAYDAPDVLIRLPCDHLFHEHCISRWLQQDGSCPQCRFNLRCPAVAAVAASLHSAPAVVERTTAVPVTRASEQSPSRTSEQSPSRTSEQSPSHEAQSPVANT